VDVDVGSITAAAAVEVVEDIRREETLLNDPFELVLEVGSIHARRVSLINPFMLRFRPGPLSKGNNGASVCVCECE
jgi:hypothetical protein